MIDPKDMAPEAHNWRWFRTGFCKCEICEASAKKKNKLDRDRARDKKAIQYFPDTMKHGISGYNLGCRCKECKEAQIAAKIRNNKETKNKGLRAPTVIKPKSGQRIEFIVKSKAQHDDNGKVIGFTSLVAFLNYAATLCRFSIIPQGMCDDGDRNIINDTDHVMLYIHNDYD